MTLLCRGLQVRYGGALVLEAVDLDAPGGWLGLAGANGAGKSSLLQAIVGRVPLAGGEVWLDGENLTSAPSERARQIGFAPDPNDLPEALSGNELFALLAQARGGFGGAFARLNEALELGALARRVIQSLSAGERQRVALACAAIGAPRALVFDEPFNWLDPKAAIRMKEALAGLAQEGIPVLTALHDPALLAIRCDAGILLSKGRVARQFDRAALRARVSDLPAFERELAALM